MRSSIQASKDELIIKLAGRNLRLFHYIQQLRKSFNADLSLLLTKFFPADEVCRVAGEVKGLQVLQEEDVVALNPFLIGDGVVILEDGQVLTHLIDDREINRAYEKLTKKSAEFLEPVMISVSSYEKLSFKKKADTPPVAEQKIEKLLRLSEEERGIQTFNYIVEQAIYHNASDVHFEFNGNTSIIRFRKQGTLEVFANITPEVHYTLINYLKNQIGAEGRKDTRKDGSIRKEGVDIRVSIMPAAPYDYKEGTTNERAVLRILRKVSSLSRGITSIASTSVEEDIFKTVIASSYGMVITSGPTSSGKTTTLYAMLSSIDAMSRKIITAEDPIEFLNPYLWQQHQVSEALSWEEIMKGMLREDPDVCLVGEVRDSASAKMLVRLANTGHLVFSTLHANNAYEVVKRLKDLDVEEKDILEFGVLFMAQRLLRQSCPHCQIQRQLSDVEAKILMVERMEVMDNEGCEECEYTGVDRRKDRKLVIELLPVYFEDVKKKVEKGTGYKEIFEYLKEQYGIERLAEKALRMNGQGLVSITEIMEKVR